MTIAVRVDGLNEFQRAVRNADRQLAIELRKGLNEAATVVATAARPNVASRSGRLRASLKAQSTQREGRAVMGSTSVPYAGWWEFGGAVGIGGSVVRSRVPQGRAMYPAFVAHRGQVEAIAERVLSHTADRAGL